MSETLADNIKGNILIVDDNPVNIKLLSGMLSNQQYRVRVTTSGQRALDAVHAEHPDLIMLDINMPVMDGYEVCRILKADKETSLIPVIFISALDEVMDKVKAFKVGGIDYVTKPFHVEEVLARIETQLDLARMRNQLARKNAELEKKNAEILQAQAELMQTYRQADMIFAALSDTLMGSVLDDKYELEGKIGTGGFGLVYRAKHLVLNRPVALKIFRPAAGSFTAREMDKIRLEGVSATRISHPNAVSILDFAVSKIGVPYLVMELLEGHALDVELEQQRKLTTARALEIMLPVCQVLAEAHAANVVHCDIKPGNIFLHQGKDGEIVKLLDFGIAHLINESERNATQSLYGTPAYIPPERWSDRPYDGKADVYSLGITLYEILTGMVPFFSFDESAPAIMMMHINAKPQPLREFDDNISPLLESIVLQTLEKDPSLRPTAKELAQMLMDIRK